MLIFNPVLTGFHPDPSILRVGDTYYLANSTFEWYPGVELHRSKDLAHWEHLPSPLATTRLLDMAGNGASCGIWAPCLSWNAGVFYLVYTNTRSWKDGPWKDSPNYLTTATYIEGPWSNPVFLNCSGFDASMFHDDDGRHYLVNMEWDYRKAGDASAAGRQFTGILLQEYSPARKRLVGKPRKIFTGTALGLVEGPHLYRRGGWYYLLTAEGGTQYSHAATVARARNIDGPYEVRPGGPLITSYHWPDWPLQKAGHASWCGSPDGKRTYLAFLCGRPLPGTRNCPLGRETGIAELEWREDWPWIKYSDGSCLDRKPPEAFGAGAVNYPPLAFDAPASGEAPARTPKRYVFTQGGVGEGSPGGISGIDAAFKTLRHALDKGDCSLTARPGFLRLRGGQSPVSRFNQTLIARRQEDFSFDAETCMEFEPESFQEMAGLCWRYDEDNQYLLALSRDEAAGKSLSVLALDGGRFTRTGPVPVPLEKGRGIYLGLSVREREGFFRYSLDGKTWTLLRPALDAAVLSDEHFYEGFTGAFTGLFCADTARYAALADFAWFEYRPVQK